MFITEAVLQRSKKYSTYTDEQLIKLFGDDSLKGNNKHYLLVELRHRELLEKAEQQKPLIKKSKPKSKKMILAGVVVAALILMRVLQRMF